MGHATFSRVSRSGLIGLLLAASRAFGGDVVQDTFPPSPLCSFDDLSTFEMATAGESDGATVRPSETQTFQLFIPADALPARPWRACGFAVLMEHEAGAGQSMLRYQLRRGVAMVEGEVRASSSPSALRLLTLCEDARCFHRSGDLSTLFSPDHMSRSRWTFTVTNAGHRELALGRPILVIVGFKP